MKQYKQDKMKPVASYEQRAAKALMALSGIIGRITDPIKFDAHAAKVVCHAPTLLAAYAS